jgi:hypothetical protein
MDEYDEFECSGVISMDYDNDDRRLALSPPSSPKIVTSSTKNGRSKPNKSSAKAFAARNLDSDNESDKAQSPSVSGDDESDYEAQSTSKPKKAAPKVAHIH